MKYGKLIDGKVEYAGKTIVVDGIVHTYPTEADYLAAGYKPVIDHMPPSREGGYWTADGWTETEAAIERVYKWVEIEPQPRRWTPLTMKRGAVAKNWWGTFKVVLEKFEAYEDFLMCQFIAENDPMFQPIYQALCAKYGEEEVKNYLDRLEVE